MNRLAGFEVGPDAALTCAAQLLTSARKLLVITGAGISVDSGLPTYRGVGGLYNADPEEDMPIERIVSAETFAERPELTWKYLAKMEEAGRKATFNRAHAVLAEIERCGRRVCVLTQNVDGLHRAAGSSDVIDIHGDLHDLLCTRCGDTSTVKTYEHLSSLPPRCGRCEGIIRPQVTLFDEALDRSKLERLDEVLDEGVDMVMSVGTSSLFTYVIGPVLAASVAGIPTIEINPDETDLSAQVALKLEMGATDGLDGMWRRVSETGRNV